MNDFIAQTLQRHAPVSDQVSRADIALILRQLDAVLQKDISGDTVELGPRLTPAGTLLIDDYQREALPGQNEPFATSSRPSLCHSCAKRKTLL